MLNLNRANRNAIMSIVALIALIFVLGMLKTPASTNPDQLPLRRSTRSLSLTWNTVLNAPPVTPARGAPTRRVSHQVVSVALKSSSRNKRAMRLRTESVDL